MLTLQGQCTYENVMRAMREVLEGWSLAEEGHSRPGGYQHRLLNVIDDIHGEIVRCAGGQFPGENRAVSEKIHQGFRKPLQTSSPHVPGIACKFDARTASFVGDISVECATQGNGFMHLFVTRTHTRTHAYTHARTHTHTRVLHAMRAIGAKEMLRESTHFFAVHRNNLCAVNNRAHFLLCCAMRVARAYMMPRSSVHLKLLRWHH